jgi:opacity protein-like surface antigen
MSKRTRSLHALALAAALLFAGLPGTATADGYAGLDKKKKDDFGRAGGYLALGAGGAASMFTGTFDPVNDALGQAILIGLRGGARMNRFFALDVSLDYSIRGFEGSLSDGTFGELKSVTGFGNLKFYPFGGRVQPFGLGGVGFVWGAANLFDSGGTLVYTAEDVGFAWRAGGGLDFYLTRNLALSGEVAYVVPTNTFDGFNYLSYTGHLVFRF